MKPKTTLIRGALGLAALGCRLTAAAAGPLAADTLWDDGRAEFSIYQGVKQRYGSARDLTAEIVIVKEDLLREALVKSDRGPLESSTVTVIKVNWNAEFQTGMYTYHQMASVFLERPGLRLLKEAMSSTELCGITYVQERAKGRDLVHRSHSYFEGDGDRELRLEGAADAVPWDGLPLWLRDQEPGKDWTRKVRLLPSRVSNRVLPPAVLEATLRCGAGETLQVPAGRYATRRVDVVTPSGTDRFWLDARYPHVLVQLATADGNTLRLRKTMRIDYWRHHDPGDERLLQ